MGGDALVATHWKVCGVRSPVERVMDRIVVDEAGCWIFQGAKTSAGYGNIRIGSRTDGTRRVIETHTVMWESQHGPVPEGLELDHLCRVRACCNPAHLEPVTPSVNVWRAMQHLSDEERQRRSTECSANMLAGKRAKGLIP